MTHSLHKKWALLATITDGSRCWSSQWRLDFLHTLAAIGKDDQGLALARVYFYNKIAPEPQPSVCASQRAAVASFARLGDTELTSPSSAPALTGCCVEALIPELAEEATAMVEPSLPAVTVGELLASLAQRCLGACPWEGAVLGGRSIVGRMWRWPA
jgi:hypothetical protein